MSNDRPLSDWIEYLRGAATADWSEMGRPVWSARDREAVLAVIDAMSVAQRERDAFRAAVDAVLVALYEVTGDTQTYPLTALGARVRSALVDRHAAK